MTSKGVIKVLKSLLEHVVKNSCASMDPFMSTDSDAVGVEQLRLHSVESSHSLH